MILMAAMCKCGLRMIVAANGSAHCSHCDRDCAASREHRKCGHCDRLDKS